MRDEPIGETFAWRYRILEILGQGGMGTVYKALDTRLQRLVALKVLQFAPDAESKQRFLTEAEALARLSHPNIPQVYDFGDADGLLYLAVEYVEGRSLRQIMPEGKPLNPDYPDYAAEIIRHVGTALSYAHQRGVIHRDVKPSNILISNGRVLLTDFGLAIAPGASTLTAGGTIAGTPAYMSPEQAMGKPVDARSDIFSLGVVFYELLAGRKPFCGDSPAETLRQIVEQEPGPPKLRHSSGRSNSLVNIVLKSLAKAPEQRYQTADEFVSALAEAAPAAFEGLSARACDGEPRGSRRASPQGIDERAKDKELGSLLDQIVTEGRLAEVADIGREKNLLNDFICQVLSVTPDGAEVRRRLESALRAVPPEQAAIRDQIESLLRKLDSCEPAQQEGTPLGAREPVGKPQSVLHKLGRTLSPEELHRRVETASPAFPTEQTVEQHDGFADFPLKAGAGSASIFVEGEAHLREIGSTERQSGATADKPMLPSVALPPSAPLRVGRRSRLGWLAGGLAGLLVVGFAVVSTHRLSHAPAPTKPAAPPLLAPTPVPPASSSQDSRSPPADSARLHEPAPNQELENELGTRLPSPPAASKPRGSRTPGRVPSVTPNSTAAAPSPPLVRVSGGSSWMAWATWLNHHRPGVLAALGASFVFWLLWHLMAARAGRAQTKQAALSTRSSPLLRLDLGVSARADHPQPTSLEKMAAQREVSDRQATQTGLRPYSPPPLEYTRILQREIPLQDLLKPGPTAMAWFLVLNGPLRSHQFRLNDSSTIGRGSDNCVVLADAQVSRLHARVWLENNRFYVSDMSVNGTWVNGARVGGEHRELHDRDEVQIGNTIMLFVQAVTPGYLTSDAIVRLRQFDSVWEELTSSVRPVDKEHFGTLTGKLVNGLLREAIGYTVEYPIPSFHGIVGYMVEAPMLWIRHSRFPVLFLAYDQHEPDVLNNVVKQLEMAKATEFFALLVVVAARGGMVNEAGELRHTVANSIYRYDFVVLDRQHLTSIVARNSSQRLIEIILQQGIELSSLSPYIVKGPVPEKMFFGREREIKAISQTIQSGDYAIVGGRRIGKSSTMLRLKRLFNNDPRYRAFYINCEDKFDYGDLFRALGNEFGNLRDGSDPLTFRELVTELKAKSPARQVVFLLDEVDELLAFDTQAKTRGQLFKTFRALSHEGACRFVFSGSRTLYRHLHNPKSPFFNFCEDITLKLLEERSTAEIVSKPMHQLGIELHDEEALIDRMIDLSSSHPSIAQWLCDRLIKTISARRISLNDLEKVAADPDFCRHYVETAWSDATPMERLISLCVAGPSFQADQLYAVLSSSGVTDRTKIQESLEMLQLYSLLERNGQEYRFALAHFPRMARQIDDVASQIECLLGQVKV
jgi:hypothetical protein